MSSEDYRSQVDIHGDSGQAGHDGGEHGEGNWLVSYADMMTLLVGFFVILNSFSTMDAEKFEEAKKHIAREFGGKYERPFDTLAEKLRHSLTLVGSGSQIAIKTTEKGIELSFLGPVFFATGSADFMPQAKELLDSLVTVFNAESGDFKYVIEGHTDDVPISSNLFKNNWELSSIRACRVLSFFADKGFDRTRLTAIGYGETRPVLPNRDSSGVAIPENQAQNRRVIIKLEKSDQTTL